VGGISQVDGREAWRRPWRCVKGASAAPHGSRWRQTARDPGGRRRGPEGGAEGCGDCSGGAVPWGHGVRLHRHGKGAARGRR
jgi:hypothetical protein